MIRFIFFLIFVSCFTFVAAQSLKGKSVIFYTKNGKGYVHDNISSATKCFDSLSHALGFKLIKSPDATVFTEEQLRKTDLIVFASTNNDVFDTDVQRLSFRHYFEAGGRVLTIHSAIGTERNWTWFKQMLGGTFAWHPHFQPFEVVKLQPQHPTMKHLPAIWTKQDECYFNKELWPGVECILAADLKSLHMDSTETVKFNLNRGTFGDYYPISWVHRFDGGLMYFTSLGHDSKDYQGGIFVDYIVDAMNFLLSTPIKLDYKKAYATGRDEVVKNLKK